MKIVLLASGTVYASLTARMLNVGRELVKYGHEVVLIAPRSDKYSHFKVERVAEVDGIKVIQPFQLTTHFQLLNLLPYIPAAAWHIWRQNADIIHLYKPTPITLVGLLAKLRRRTRVVLDMDDLGSQVMIREKNPAWKVKLVATAERLAARYSQGIITVSSYLRDYYRGTYSQKPILWAPNGDTKIEWGTAKSAPPIVFIGSLNDLSIITPLIEALPEVRAGYKTNKPLLQIIGDGTKREELLALVSKLGLESAVLFSSGWVDPSELTKHVAVGSLGYCCVPDDDTYRAASSQKIFNYLSMGVVPIVNKVGDLPYYVENGKSGYIIEDDLAKTLTEALQDKTDRTEKAHAGRRYLESNFLWNILAKKIESFYYELRSSDEASR